MSRNILKVVTLFGIVLALGAVGLYIDSKPYQRERLWQSVHSIFVYGPDRTTAHKP